MQTFSGSVVGNLMSVLYNMVRNGEPGECVVAVCRTGAQIAVRGCHSYSHTLCVTELADQVIATGILSDVYVQLLAASAAGGAAARASDQAQAIANVGPGGASVSAGVGAGAAAAAPSLLDSAAAAHSEPNTHNARALLALLGYPVDGDVVQQTRQSVDMLEKNFSRELADLALKHAAGTDLESLLLWLTGPDKVPFEQLCAQQSRAAKLAGVRATAVSAAPVQSSAQLAAPLPAGTPERPVNASSAAGAGAGAGAAVGGRAGTGTGTGLRLSPVRKERWVDTKSSAAAGGSTTGPKPASSSTLSPAASSGAESKSSKASKLHQSGTMPAAMFAAGAAATVDDGATVRRNMADAPNSPASASAASPTGRISSADRSRAGKAAAPTASPDMIPEVGVLSPRAPAGNAAAAAGTARFTAPGRHPYRNTDRPRARKQPGALSSIWQLFGMFMESRSRTGEVDHDQQAAGDAGVSAGAGAAANTTLLPGGGDPILDPPDSPSSAGLLNAVRTATDPGLDDQLAQTTLDSLSTDGSGSDTAGTGTAREAPGRPRPSSERAHAHDYDIARLTDMGFAPEQVC